MSESGGCCGHGSCSEETLTVATPGVRFTGTERLGDVAARVPGARQVLERFGLNHCCGAHLTLDEGAAAAGVPIDAVLRALEQTGTPT